MSNPNQKIIDALTHIADAYRSQGVLYKYKAYRTCMDSIRSVGTPITSIDQVRSLPGIGKAMLEKIEELLTTGSLQQEREVLADPVTQATQLFTSIHGIGPVLAKKLVHEQGLRTLEDLERIIHTLPPQTRLGLKYHNDTSLRVPFDEIEDHFRLIKATALRVVDPQLQLCICGSHRRCADTSGDIDLLVTHPASGSDSGCEYTYLHAIASALKAEGYIVDTLAEGNSKFMGYCRLKSNLPVRRLDIRWMPYDFFVPALLYFTGSDLFNITMRMEALKRGYSINEYGIYEVVGYEHLHRPGAAPVADPKDLPHAGAEKGKRVPVRCEKDIFDLVGMKYLEPNQRSK